MNQYKLTGGKGPVYKLDRVSKAQKIKAIIDNHADTELRGLKVLDIGCGNGGIGSVFSDSNDVYGVDIEDLRLPESKIKFSLVDSALLPFDDKKFDIIISNHTIEHIDDQATHLSEIHRTLKDDGLVYIATPNKSSPIMEGHIGNDLVLRFKHMAPTFKIAGFSVSPKSTEILKHPDVYKTGIRVFKYFPRFILDMLQPMMPSHIFILNKRKT